jgi:hypothetical protein
MQLSLIVVSVVLGVTVVFGIAGYLIDLSARHFEQSRDSRNTK